MEASGKGNIPPGCGIIASHLYRLYNNPELNLPPYSLSLLLRQDLATGLAYWYPPSPAGVGLRGVWQGFVDVLSVMANS